MKVSGRAMTEFEKMVGESMYDASDKELMALRDRARRLNRLYNETTEEEMEKRNALLKELLGKTGKNFFIEPNFRCDYGCNISIGENFYANFDCIIIDGAKVDIGNDAMLAPRVGIYTATHPIDAGTRIRGLLVDKSISIGDNAWIGADAIINPGVKIGKNVVIGSGSVVTKDIPDDVVAAGNPCRVIRKIGEEDKMYWERLEREYNSSI